MQFPIARSYLHSPNRRAPSSLLVSATPLQVVVGSLGCLWDVLAQVLGVPFPPHPAPVPGEGATHIRWQGRPQIPHLPDWLLLVPAGFHFLSLHPGWKMRSDHFYPSVNHHLVKASSFNKQSRQIRRKLIEFLHSS